MNANYISNKTSLPLPFSGNRYIVNLGINTVNVYDNQTETILPTKTVNNRQTVELVWLNGDTPQGYDLAEVVAHTYKPIYADVTVWSKFGVLFENGKQEYVHPSNLIWYNKEGPVANPRYPDYYIIPEYSKYSISKTGAVILTVTGEEIACHEVSGYIEAYVERDYGKRAKTYLHRLLGLAFIPYTREVNKMVINHIDENKNNNVIENLEWVTRTENWKHSSLLRTGEEKIFPSMAILSRNVVTGEIIRYDSIRSAARLLGLNAKSMDYRVRKSGQPVYGPKPGYQFKFEGDETPWREPSKEEIAKVSDEKKTDPRARKIEAKNTLTGEVVVVNNLNQLSMLVGAPKRTLSADINGEIEHKVRNGWDFRYVN